ncbi:MAG: hypothetical protein IPL83_16245 [Bdellovibrionales bacterium]|nr:hypothetical protein [Bdellovibrionales bacterium]
MELLKRKNTELDMWMQKRLEIESNLQKEKLRHVQIAERTPTFQLSRKGHEKIEPQGSRNCWMEFVKQIGRHFSSFFEGQRKARLESLDGAV